MDDRRMERFEESRSIPILRHAIGPWRLTVERRRPTDAQLEHQYRRIARSWSARMRVLGFQAAYRNLIRRLIDEGELGLSSGSLRVLDAGIGGGDLSLALFEEAETSLRLDGVDLCPEMLDAASKTLRSVESQVCLRQGDIQGLPYANDQFDLVLAGHVLEHLSSPSRALCELHRVLKPTGRLLLIVTRKTLAGKAIQMRWGTRCFDETTLNTVLRRGGAKDWTLVPLMTPPWCNWLSRACVATF